MADFDIKILLAQAQDDPRFQNITTNGLRMGSTTLSNDPIVSGVDGGNAPLLFNVTSNTPGLFDVLLDVFILLREEITNTVTLTDVVERVQSTKYLSFVNIDDLVTTKYATLKEELLQIISRTRVLQEKSLLDVFKISDTVDDIFESKRYRDLANSINFISKDYKVDIHRGLKPETEFPNYALANRVSKDYGMIAGLGRDVTASHPFKDQPEDTYEFVHTTQPAYLPVLPAGTSGLGYWKAPIGGYFNTINSQNPNDPLGDLSNKHVLYGDENGVVPLAPYGVSPSMYGGFFPFWDRDEISNRFGEFASGYAGYVYWWMPEYRLQYGPFRFTDEAYTGIPESGTFSITGVGVFTNVVNRAGNLYFYDVKNGSFPPTNIGINIPFDPSGAVEVISARTLPANASVSLPGPGDLAVFLDAGVKLEKGTALTVDKVHLASQALSPKARLVLNRLKTDELLQFSQTLNISTENITIDDSVDDELKKHLRQILKYRELILNPKALINVDKLLAASTTNKKVTKPIVSHKIKTIDIVRKDVQVNEHLGEDAELTSSLLFNPANFILTTNRAETKTEKELKVEKEVLNKLKLIDRENFKINRTLFEIFDARNSLIDISKSRIQNDVAKSFSETHKNLGKPIPNKLKLPDFISKKPNIDVINKINLRNNVNVSKDRLITERLFLISDIDIIKDFRLGTNFAVNDKFERVLKFIQTRLHNEEVDFKEEVLPAKVKLITERLGVSSKDRDGTGGRADVFFKFMPSEVQHRVDLDDNEFDRLIKKPFVEKNNLRVKLLLAGKSKQLTNSIDASEELHAFKIGKGVLEIINLISTKVKDTDKPIKNVTGYIDEISISRAPPERSTTLRINVKDKFEPLVFGKIIPEHFVSTISFTSKKTEKNDEGITEFLSSSEKGYVWMRDEEYTRGAYFLEPYVAAIPPGRSRQF